MKAIIITVCFVFTIATLLLAGATPGFPAWALALALALLVGAWLMLDKLGERHE